MNKIKSKVRQAALSGRNSSKVLLLLAATLMISGCYTTQAKRDFDAGGIAPWWCQAVGVHPALSQSDCLTFSLRMDVAVDLAKANPTVLAATNAGAVAIANQPAGIGYAMTRPGAAATFDPARPNVLLYNGSSSNSRVAGLAWRFFGAEPVGHPGDRDEWVFNSADGHWWLTLWAVRGYQNHPNVFAAAHPCLATGVTLASTTDACYVASHTEPLEIVVANDDGYTSEGIYELADGLSGLGNTTVHVVAPLANQSGSGDQTTQPPFVTSGTLESIGEAPGNVYPAWAIASTDTDPSGPRKGSGSPADAVLYALNVLSLSPEIVISGINDGQNLASIGSNVSGTVGAARVARRNGVASIATSAAGVVNAVPDFPTSVAATLDLLEQWRLGLTADSTKTVLNINIPTCPLGAVQGVVQTVVGLSISGRPYGYFDAADCTSLQTTFLDDLDAYHNGYVSIADMGTYSPPNWP